MKLNRKALATSNPQTCRDSEVIHLFNKRKLTGKNPKAFSKLHIIDSSLIFFLTIIEKCHQRIQRQLGGPEITDYFQILT